MSAVTELMASMEILRAQNAELVAALQRFVDEYDPEGDLPEAGCIECILGATPDRLNTGLCVHHNARAVLAKVRS